MLRLGHPRRFSIRVFRRVVLEGFDPVGECRTIFPEPVAVAAAACLVGGVGEPVDLIGDKLAALYPGSDVFIELFLIGSGLLCPRARQRHSA